MENLPQISKNNYYNLTIRFAYDGFLLSILDESKNIISKKQISAELFSMSEQQITDLIVNDPDTQADYKSFELICESDLYTFIPMSYFNSEDKNHFLHFEQKPKNTDIVLINKLPNWETVNVFSIPIALNNCLINIYPDFQINHHISYLLTNKIPRSSETEIYIWVRANIMDVVVIKTGNIQLINSFAYKTTEDFVYFTLNIFEQLMLNTETCKVKLFHSDSKPELKNCLLKYIKTVSSIL